MRRRKTSTGNASNERCKYLAGVPEQMRNLDDNGVKRVIKIVRTGTLPGGSHSDVKIFQNGTMIYHATQ